MLENSTKKYQGVNNYVEVIYKKKLKSLKDKWEMLYSCYIRVVIKKLVVD